MKTLTANAIRVYHVDPTADHDGCMSAFADQGIYLLLDLDTFDTQIDPVSFPTSLSRDKLLTTPQTVTTWNQTQLDAFSRVMDAFAGYDNTLGFFIGNEVVAQANQSLAAPFIKAAARDLKAYRDSKNYRNIPVGYSAADISALRPMLQNYLVCGSNTSETIDMFGLNAYEWCGPHDMQSSGYALLNTYAENFNVPIFFSETGCNTAPPRTFQDQGSILGPDMDTIWSGAIIYEWIQESNGYGLISYGPSVNPTAVASGVVGGFSRTGVPSPVLPDFTNLKSQWATLNPTGVASSDYKATITPPACPSSTAGGWLVNGDVPLPTLGATLIADSTPTANAVASGSGTATGSAGSPASTKKSQSPANGGKQVTAMAAGLVAVSLGFMYWL